MGAVREDAKPQRLLRRCHETSRLEEQLWILAFEELWPVAARSTRRASIAERGDPQGLEQQQQLARRA